MNTFVKTAEVTRLKALQLVSLIAYRRARLPAPVRLPAVPYSDKLNIIYYQQAMKIRSVRVRPQR